MTKQYRWIDWIEERVSVRTYDNQRLTEYDFNDLNTFIHNEIQSSKTTMRIEIIHSNLDSNTNQKFGTYGFINGTNSFIAGIINKNETNLVEFGYTMEKIVLFATGCGFGTCWLGGTFNRSQFEEVLNLDENESIGVLIAIGYKKDKQTIMDHAVRYMAKANTRKLWNELFFDKSIEFELNKNDLYSTVLEMVRIGPSASNKQPWRIIKDEMVYHFYCCRTPGYGIMEFDLQMNDMGIAMCHFELSATELGFRGSWEEVKSKNIDGLEYIKSWKIENTD